MSKNVIFEEDLVNDVEVHWERPLKKKWIRVEVTFISRKNGI